MYGQLLETVRGWCSSEGSRTINVGIGASDPRAVHAVGRELAGVLGHGRVVIIAYHPIGPWEPQTSRPGVDHRACQEPIRDMISDFKAGKLDAIVRGQFSSSSFLAELKWQFSIQRTCRLALLTTSNDVDFFFAPVGIDEAGDPREKKALIELASELLSRIGLVPSFFLLSAGRLDDVGRSERIGASIRETIALVEAMGRENPGIAVQHGEILIENAFEKGANAIIAPDGISGNLIYRTLLHLGGGHSHGAFFLGPGFPGPVMDTSRVGTVEEHVGAVVLAIRELIARSPVRER